MKGHTMKKIFRSPIAITAAILIIVIGVFVAVKVTGTKQNKDVVLVTHDSFVMSKSLIQEFDKTTGYNLRLLTSEDAGAMTNRLILTKADPIADAVFGIDNTLAGEAEANNLIAGPLVPTDFGDVCFNYDKYWFAAHKIAVPASINDLINPQYKALTVVENPATSSTGLSFLATTVDKFGTPGWQKYWSALKANQVKVDDGWEAAYYTDFSGSSGKGPYPIVLSYGTSPADEVRSNGQSQTASILDGCFKQTEYVGVLKGARNPAGAEAVVRFLQSPDFQATFPGTMYMYPKLASAPIPADWLKYTQLPAKTYGDNLDFNKDRASWLHAWEAIFG